MMTNSKNIKTGDTVRENRQYSKPATVLEVRDEILVTTAGYMHTDKVVVMGRR